MASGEPIPGHVTMVTLGVDDLERATRFYEAIGFERSSVSTPQISFLKSSTIVVGLYPVDALAEDVSKPVGRPGAGAVALAQNRHSESEVDAVMAQAQSAGGSIVKPAQKVFWGGYSGYFADPDGHLWEVAHNPFAELTGDGRLNLPGRAAD